MTQQTIRTVAYWRMSTTAQEDSIENQRGAMLPLLQKETAGERIDLLKEFADEGRSGTSTKGRDSFSEMVAFCQQQHKLRAPVAMVACLETSRFSRADSIETDAALHALRESGVRWIQTKAQRYDLRNEQDLTLLSMQQNFTNHRFSKTHAERITRGRLRKFREHGTPTGAAPYGMDKIISVPTPSGGEREERVSRTHKTSCRTLRFEPSTLRPEEAATVREIFETFLRPGEVSLWSIARKLNCRDVPTARGTGWEASSIRRVLENPVYVGDTVLGRRARGKFTRLLDNGGKLEQTEGYFGDTPQQINPTPEVWRERRAGLIDGESFAAAQKKLAKRRALNLSPRESKDETYLPLLRGLLHCTTCGRRMGASFQKMPVGKVGEIAIYKNYICSGPAHKPGAGVRHVIREDRLVPTLAKVISAHAYFLRDQLADTLAKEMTARQPQPGFALADRCQQQLADLDDAIGATVRQLPRAGDNFDLLNAELSRLRKQRDAVAAEAAKCQPEVDTPEEMALRIREQIRALQALGDELTLPADGMLPGPEFAAALARVVERIDICIQPIPTGKGNRLRHQIFKVLVHLREIGVFVDVTTMLNVAA